MMREVNCPCFLCGSERSHILFETTYPYFNYPGIFRMNRCECCGLLFNSPRLADNELYKLYGEQYYFFQRREADEFRRVADIYLRTIAVIPDGISGKNAVEIGSAKGYFLALLKHLGWDVFGIEISEKAAQHAISRFGIPTFHGLIGEYAKTADRKSFPVVFAIDVIEHIPQPMDFLLNTDKTVGDNGLLIIDTPNGNAQNIATRSYQWQGFNPFHIFLFTENNLASMLTKLGYSLEKVFSYGNKREHKQQDDRQGIQNVVRSLGRSVSKKVGLFNRVQHIYNGLGEVLQKHDADPRMNLRNAARYIDCHHSYFTSEDAGHELAEGNRGDNLVVIARKCAG